jgi:hypothetical protein
MKPVWYPCLPSRYGGKFTTARQAKNLEEEPVPGLHEPAAYAELISPTPLLLVVALGDHLTVADQALAAYERARHRGRVDRKVPTLRTATLGRALLIPDQEPPAAERW